MSPVANASGRWFATSLPKPGGHDRGEATYCREKKMRWRFSCVCRRQGLSVWRPAVGVDDVKHHQAEVQCQSVRPSARSGLVSSVMRLRR